MRRQSCTFAVILLAALTVTIAPPLARGASAAGAVLLRYRFSPGEVLTYQETLTDTERMTIAGKIVDQGVETQEYQAHVIVRSVDPAGDALLSVVNDHTHVVLTHNGVTTRSTPPGDTLTSPSDACYQEVTGTQYCSYRGAFGQNDIGQVAAVPVAPGAVWLSHIDNTWAVDQRTPTYLHNVLRAVSQGPSGRVATLDTTAHVQGATDASQGEAITGTLAGDIDGTWRFAIDTGVFTGETLRETSDVSGMTRTAHGMRPASGDGTTYITMRLLSVRADTPMPFRTPGPVKTYSSTAAGFRINYPAAWTGRVASNGAFEASTSDGNAVLAVVRSPTVNPTLATDAAALRALVEKFGTPVDPIMVGQANVHGHTVGMAETVIASSGGVELQCEVQAIATHHGLYRLVSLAALGQPVWAQRLQHAAWRIEQMRRALASMTVL